MGTLFRRAPTVLVAAVLALAGCASAGSINSGQIDAKLLTYLRQQRPGVDAEVSCPSGVPVKSGATFSCSVLLDGAKTSYTVRISNVAGSRYDMEAEPAEPIFDTRQVAAAVKQQEGAGAVVNCGSVRFVQVPVHGTFSCAVSVNGVAETLTATVTDTQGRVSFAASGAGTPATAAPTLPGGG